MEPILVTGAAGQARGDDGAPFRRVQQGATGLRVTQELLKQGHEVRAFVRVDDDRAAELRKLGAEVVVGDLLKISDVIPALKGVKRAYFNYPVKVGMLEATAVFAAAARQEGLERVVAVSMYGSGTADGITPHMQRHWVGEQILTASVPQAVHIEATVFYENMAVALGNGGGKELSLPLGSADTEIPLVAAADVARVGLNQLLADKVEAEPIQLVGAVPTIGQVAEAFGVPYVDADPDEWREKALELYAGPASIEHLTGLWAMFKSLGGMPGLFQPTDYEKVNGQPPTTLQEFAASL